METQPSVHFTWHVSDGCLTAIGIKAFYILFYCENCKKF